MENIEIIISDKSKNKYEKLSSILKYVFVDIASVSQKKYYILGSFAIRKYRTISDLDINMDSREFFKLEALTKIGLGKLEFYNNQIRWFFDLTDKYNELTESNEADFSIEAFQKDKDVGYPNSDFSLGALVDANKLDVDENGHQFFNLQTLLEWKTTMNRPKDSADIELINDIIAGKIGGNKKKHGSKKGSKKNHSNKHGSKKGSKKQHGGKKNSKKGTKKGSKKQHKK